jgi:hypothetical protein
MTQAERVREAARSRVKALESLNRLDWTDLDVGAAEDSRRHQQQRLDALRAASTAISALPRRPRMKPGSAWMPQRSTRPLSGPWSRTIGARLMSLPA